MLDLIQFHLEHSSLAGQRFRLILLRERHIHVELFTCGMANNLILKAGDKLARAQGQREVFALAALKCNTCLLYTSQRS